MNVLITIIVICLIVRAIKRRRLTDSQNRSTSADEQEKTGFFRNENSASSDLFENDPELSNDRNIREVTAAMKRMADLRAKSEAELKRVQSDPNLTPEARLNIQNLLNRKIYRIRDQYSELYTLRLQYADAFHADKGRAESIIRRMEDLIEAYDRLSEEDDGTGRAFGTGILH